jgi:hypothetical protein
MSRAMCVNVSTVLAAPAARVWQAIKETTTLPAVTRGMMSLRSPEPLPREWQAGDLCRMKLAFFHVVPGWTHEIKVVGLDEARRELRSEEHGGPVRRWDHRLAVEPLDDCSSRYTDHVEIDAGLLTPAVWLFAQAFYRYRQWRWRRLIGQLVTDEPRAAAAA